MFATVDASVGLVLWMSSTMTVLEESLKLKPSYLDPQAAHSTLTPPSSVRRHIHIIRSPLAAYFIEQGRVI